MIIAMPRFICPITTLLVEVGQNIQSHVSAAKLSHDECGDSGGLRHLEHIDHGVGQPRPHEHLEAEVGRGRHGVRAHVHEGQQDEHVDVLHVVDVGPFDPVDGGVVGHFAAEEGGVLGIEEDAFADPQEAGHGRHQEHFEAEETRVIGPTVEHILVKVEKCHLFLFNIQLIQFSLRIASN